MNKKARSWCFTYNNYTEEDYARICAIDCEYLIVGKEVAPETGTRHLQGYVKFYNARYFTSIKALLGPAVHLEAAKGTPEENKEYCSKAGDYFEKGEVPRKGRRTDLEKLAKMVCDGEYEKIVTDYPKEIILHGKGLKLLKYEVDSSKVWTTIENKQVIWIYGPTGTGKTTKADEMTKDLKRYVKAGGTGKWWDGYQGQEAVILEELRPADIPDALLLQILDKRAVQIETKGGMTVLLARLIIVTTPLSPEQFWIGKPEDVKQLKRRITEEIHLTERFVDIENAQSTSLLLDEME